MANDEVILTQEGLEKLEEELKELRRRLGGGKRV